MNIYFAVSEEMIEKYGMPEQSESGHYSWTLNNDTFLWRDIRSSAGQIVDYYHGKNLRPYAICRAHLDDKIVAEALRASLVGDVIKNISVIITEITWIK